MVDRHVRLAVMSKDQESSSSEGAWEPIFDVPDNLCRDRSNHVEWIWSLHEDGIEIPLSGSFGDLCTEAGEPLLDIVVAAHLDDQLKVTRLAALANNHDLQDAVTCCKAGDLDPDPLARRAQILDTGRALSRAKAMGEICDVAVGVCREAIYLKAAPCR